MDLKKRVALDHPDWDLSGYRGTKFDYWVDEATEKVPANTLSAATREEVGGTKDTPADNPVT